MAELLIVDDQPYVRYLLAEDLARDGHRVTIVGDPDSMWAYLQAVRPDLVLLDVFWAGYKGVEVLEGLKKRFPNVYVLIVSSLEKIAGDPRLSQADGYAVKDFFSAEDVKRQIAEHLKVREAVENRPDLQAAGRGK